MLYHGNHGLGQSFQLVHQAFLHQDGIRFDDVLTAEQIGQAFEAEDALFARDEGDIYTPEIALWGALTQVLHCGVHRSCQAAVARIIMLCAALERQPPSGDTGAYCRAKAKLTEAVLRRLTYEAGDIFLGDCCFCSYFLVALFSALGVDVVLRQHQGRRTDFHLGQKLGKEDHVVTWKRPPRPEWMDEQTYATIPAELTVREVLVRVAIPGFRTRQFVVVTTLTDAQQYSQADIAGLFRMRWHVELDLRNIKVSLQLEDLRGRSPASVRREIWLHFLAYNLIRRTIARAALTHDAQPRQLSFTAGVVAVAAAWDRAATAREEQLAIVAALQFDLIARERVGKRPNRVEPRAVKRRPEEQDLLTEPRADARARLLGGSSPA